MTKPRAGNIDSFCSKLGQSNLKGLMKIPCEHKSHTKHGSGSTSGYERSRKVTGIKNSFSSTRHMIYNRFCTYNSKIEAMLQADTMHDNNREGSGQPRLTQGQIFELSCFRIENVRFWTSLNSGFQKYHFYFFTMSRIAKNGKFEKKFSHWRAGVMPRQGLKLTCTRFYLSSDSAHFILEMSKTLKKIF